VHRSGENYRWIRPRFASAGCTAQTPSPYEVGEKTAQATSDIKRDAQSLGRRDNLEASIVVLRVAWSVTLSS
jgi:hypothetical protein